MAENLPLGVKLQVIGTDAYKTAMADAEKATSKYEKEIKDLEKQFPKAANASKGLENATKQATAATDKAAKTTKAAAQESSKAASAFGQLKGAALGVAAGFTAMEVGRRVVAMIGNAIEVTKLYETALFDVTTQMGAANREFGLFEGKADDASGIVRELADEFRVFSDRDVANALARMIQMSKRLGLTEEEMMTLLSRTADLSAGKVDLASGVERVTAALRGEAESAEYLGLTLNETYVAAQAARLGFSKLWKDMSDAEKTQVRKAVLLEQSNELQGKAADSADTLAGAQGELNKEWERTQVSLGEMFIPLLRDATRGMADFLEAANRKPDKSGVFYQMQLAAGNLTPDQIAAMSAGMSPEELTRREQEMRGTYSSMGGGYTGGQPWMNRWYNRQRPSVADTYDFGTITPFSGGRGAESSQQGMQENTNEEMRRLEEERLADEEASRQKLADSWQRQADAHANMVQNIIDQQEDLNLSVAQSQEQFNLDWEHRKQDLEREIGIKVAEGFATPEDQQWWIDQRMIDFNREQTQAQEQLTLRNQQAQERLDLNAEQSGVQLGDLETAQATELQTTNDYYEEDLKPAIQTKQQEITDVLRDDIYPVRLDDWNLELAQEKAEMESAWSSMKQWIIDHPLPAFQIGGKAAEGTKLDDTTDTNAGQQGGPGGSVSGTPPPTAQFGMSGIVNRLRSITVGEGNRPEYVRVTPMGYGGGSTQFVRNFNQQVHMSMGTRSSADAQNIANQVKANMDRGARLSSQFGG